MDAYLCTALVLTIAWILGGRRGEVDDLFRSRKGINPFLILFIALVNALFILAIVVKSYNIHLNALYLNEVLAPRIRQITNETILLHMESLAWREHISSRKHHLLWLLPIDRLGAAFSFRLQLRIVLA